MANITEFGKDVKKRLVDIERTQDWLISEVRNRTGLYFDSSYLYKIMAGSKQTPKIVQAICEILDLKE